MKRTTIILLTLCSLLCGCAGERNAAPPVTEQTDANTFAPELLPAAENVNEWTLADFPGCFDSEWETARAEITLGEDYAGPVMGDISTRRGRIVGTDSNDEGETVIIVRVPYAEVVKYTKDLRSITRGSGSYSIQINGYAQAPADVTKKLVEEYQASRAAGN